MLFNSIDFLIFFLPTVLAGFFLLCRMGNPRSVMIWLIVSSLFFYAWWNPIYLGLLLFSALSNYTLGLQIRARGESGGRIFVIVGILFNLGMLAYFKYANFFLDNLPAAINPGFNLETIILPLAISFYTFQQITYLVDARKGKIEEHGFLEYMLFVCFFPQLIAGPIVHHSEMLHQFRHFCEPRDNSRQLAIGFSMIVVGLFKKVVIADGFALYATPVFTAAAAGQELNTLMALAGVFSYAFQLYFDFSGYSDMAIGLACLFGIKLPVNFFSPYRAQNISDFWRMWHATLSRFLRDYVYTPLGGFVCSPRRQRFNLFMTMFVGGIWHGAGWTFVLYGLCHGVYVVVHQLWRVKVSAPQGWLMLPLYRHASQLLTFLVVVFTLVLFRSDSAATALHVYSQIFQPADFEFGRAFVQEVQRTNLFKLASIPFSALTAEWLLLCILSMALAICWLLPSTYQLFKLQEVAIDKPPAGRPAVWQLEWAPNRRWTLFIAVLAVAGAMNLTQVSEFLYFQF